MKKWIGIFFTVLWICAWFVAAGYLVYYLIQTFSLTLDYAKYILGAIGYAFLGIVFLVIAAYCMDDKK